MLGRLEGVSIRPIKLGLIWRSLLEQNRLSEVIEEKNPPPPGAMRSAIYTPNGDLLRLSSCRTAGTLSHLRRVHEGSPP
jgi:hypothetical protein